MATKYTVTDCEPFNADVPEPVLWLNPIAANLELDECSSIYEPPAPYIYKCIKKWSNSSPISNDLTFVGGIQTAKPRHLNSYLNNKPAASFKMGVSLASQTSSLRFSGVDISNSDYTIMAVLNFNQNFQTCTPFIGGSSEIENNRLEVGFKGVNQLFLSHYGGRVETEIPESLVEGNHIFCFAFSQINGLIISVDGIELKHVPDFNNPLQSFPGAYLGLKGFSDSCDPNGFGSAHLIVSELFMFDKALNKAQRQSLENELRQKYLL